MACKTDSPPDVAAPIEASLMVTCCGGSWIVRAVSKIVRKPIRVRHQPTTKAVHRRRMHTEQAPSDLRLTTRQRSLRSLVQDFRNLPLAIARGLVSKHRATPRFRTVARSLSTLWVNQTGVDRTAYAIEIAVE